MAVTKMRRICWPNPDATCLQGGCIHCSDHPYRSVDKIKRYAERLGDLPNRCGDETTNALKAFQYGERRRRRPAKEEST
jgi:hypothetical protein